MSQATAPHSVTSSPVSTGQLEEPISRLRVPTEDELPQKLRDIHMRI